MRPTVAIVYNEPAAGRYGAVGEARAVLAVLDEVEAVERALAESEYPTARVPLRPPLERVRDDISGMKADAVFNLFEGFDDSVGSEAAVAEILAETGTPFTGSSGYALRVAVDKMTAGRLLDAAGIATPRCQVLTPATLPSFVLGYPCIVKPCNEHASHGLSSESVVHDRRSLAEEIVRISSRYGGEALVEEYLSGREFNATVLGNERPAVLPISEIVYSLPHSLPRLLTFEAKWDPDSVYFKCTQPVCPAWIDDGLRREMADMALKAFRVLRCCGYARVDFRLDDHGEPHVLDVNPNPDRSPCSGVARQARAAGMQYGELIAHVLQLALGGSQ